MEIERSWRHDAANHWPDLHRDRDDYEKEPEPEEEEDDDPDWPRDIGGEAGGA